MLEDYSQWERSCAEFEEMVVELEAIRDINKSWKLSPGLWPNAAAYLGLIIEEDNFQGIPLVEGWFFDTEAITNRRTPVGWKERQADDCHTDAITFLKDITAELQTRLSNSVPPAVAILYKVVDLISVLNAVTGSWNFSVEEPLVKGVLQETVDSYCQFFHYVQSLPHLKV